MINFAHKSRLISVFEIICNVYSIIWWSVHTTYWNKSIMKISHVLGKARSIFFMMTHILLFFFHLGLEGSGLNFYQNKSQLVSSSCISKRHSKFAKPILYIIWLKSILVLLNHFIINDVYISINIYVRDTRWSTYCTYALINILHFTHKYAFVNLPEEDYLKKPSRSCYEWSRIFIFRCDISNRDC